MGDSDASYITEEEAEEERYKTACQRTKLVNGQARILNQGNLTPQPKFLVIIPHCLFSKLNYKDKEDLFLDA